MNPIQKIARHISSIKTSNIPRIEDLPYATSLPIQFVYESTANLQLGTYIWNDTQSELSPDRPVLSKALYYFRSFSLTANIEELDFTSSIVTTPKFFMFKTSDAKAVMFREPIQMNKFYDQFDYRLAWWSNQDSDQLFGAFRGTILQTPALLGKASITLKSIITAQEIIDDNFVRLFKSNYPTPPKDLEILDE